MLTTKILVMFGAFILLSAVGLGPAITLTSNRYKRRILVSLALSPAIGLIIIAFPLYILFLLGLPIGISAIPVTLAGMIVSILLIGFDWRSRPVDYSGMLSGIPRWKLLAVVATWVSAVCLLLLPSIVGGEAFQYYQSNTYDAAGYVLMAEFGKAFPASYIRDTAHYDEILRHNPTLNIVMSGLANVRPSVSHLLAWQSVLFNETPLNLYHFAKLLSLLITVAVTSALGYQFGLRLWQQLGLMLVSSVGFWAVYVLDVDAFSQIYAIPLSLLLIFAFVQFECENRTQLFSRQRWFLALGMAGLVCFYPEISLFFIPTLALYYGLAFLLNPSRSTIKVIALHALTILLAVLLLNIILPPILKFALGQAQFAANVDATRNWGSLFFHWLFFDRDAWITGAWGLYYVLLTGSGLLLNSLSTLFVVMIFICMSAILGNGLLRGLTTRFVRPESRLLALLIAVYWGGGVCLYLIGTDWVGGKTMAMGAPFVMLGVFVFFKDHFSHASLLNRLLQIGLIIWIIAQILVLPLQTLAITKRLTIRYTVDLSQPTFPSVILPLFERLKQEKITLIGFDVPNPKSALTFTIAMTLANLAPIWFSDGIPSYFEQPESSERWMTTDFAPDHLVLAEKRDYLKPLGLGQNLITMLPSFPIDSLYYVTAYAVNPEEFDQALYRADILNPDIPIAPIVRGMDAVFLPNKGGQFVRWMTNNSSEIHFVSSTNQRLGIYLESSAGYNGNMTLDLNDVLVGQFRVKKEAQIQKNGICVTTKMGTNVLKFTHENPKTKQINQVLIHKLLFAPVDRLDVGHLTDARQIGEGWEGQENWGEETIRWAGQNAQLQIMTCGESAGKELHFRAFLPTNIVAQTVTVLINGSEMSTITLQSGWKEYVVMISDEKLRPSGLQQIELRHSATFIPAEDTRTLSAAYDRFWFTNN